MDRAPASGAGGAGSTPARRTKLGLTQDDLAKKADIKYTTLMKVESGVVNKPSVKTMAKIAKALRVSIEGLLK